MEFVKLENLHFDAASLVKAAGTIDFNRFPFPTCDHFAVAFFQQIEHNAELTDALRFLAIICSWRLRPDDQHQPFDFLWAPYDLAQITTEQLESLSAAVTHGVDPDLQAVFADLIWLRQRNHVFARIAAEQYLESGRRLTCCQKVLGEAERITRSLQLAAMVGRSDGFLETIVERVTQLSETPTLLHCSLDSCLKALSKSPATDARRLYAVAVGRAQLVSSEPSSSHWERRFWHHAAYFAGKLKEDSLERDALLSAARTFEREAEIVPMQVVAAHFWLMALIAYRRIPDTEADRQRVHRNHLDAQSHIKGEMFCAGEFTDDITAKVMKARERIQGNDKRRDIAEFVFATHWLSKTYLRDQAIDSSTRFPLQQMLGTLRFGSTWKTAATAPAGSFDPAAVSKERLNADMCQQYRIQLPYLSIGTIEPMREKLIDSHCISLEDVAEFVFNSPFVPAGHESIIVVGLHAGFHGKFIEAIHVLVPQLEHMLRCHLENVITSSIDDDGIQQEYDLNRLLYLPETEAFLGEDLSFTCRFLFTERHGYNLRNEMAHGMKPAAAFFTPEAVYAWWLILRLTASHYAHALLSTDSAGQSDDETPDFVI